MSFKLVKWIPHMKSSIAFYFFYVTLKGRKTINKVC